MKPGHTYSNLSAILLIYIMSLFPLPLLFSGVLSSKTDLSRSTDRDLRSQEHNSNFQLQQTRAKQGHSGAKEIKYVYFTPVWACPRARLLRHPGKGQWEQQTGVHQACHSGEDEVSTESPDKLCHGPEIT